MGAEDGKGPKRSWLFRSERLITKFSSTLYTRHSEKFDSKTTQYQLNVKKQGLLLHKDNKSRFEALNANNQLAVQKIKPL